MSGLNPGGALLEYHPVEGVQRNRLTDEQCAPSLLLTRLRRHPHHSMAAC
jgi:hypothetical protein